MYSVWCVRARMNNERTNGVLKQTAGPPECVGTWGLVPTVFGRYMNPIPIIGGNDAHSKINLFPTPHQYLRHSGAPNYSNEYSTIHGCKLYYHAMSLFLPYLFASDKLNLELIWKVLIHCSWNDISSLFCWRVDTTWAFFLVKLWKKSFIFSEMIDILKNIWPDSFESMKVRIFSEKNLWLKYEFIWKSIVSVLVPRV